MIRHVVMWRVKGDTAAQRQQAGLQVKRAFESLRGQIPGMLRLEVGIDLSGVDYACEVVLVSDFETPAALRAYAGHPAHLRVRAELDGVRTTRHQVDYLVE